MSKNNKDIFLIILIIITIISILAGLYIHVFSKMNLNFNFSSTNDTVVIKDKINSLEIDFDMGEIEVLYGDELSVNYETLDSLRPNISTAGGALIIKSNSENKINFFPFFDINAGKIKVTLPKNQTLTSARINSDFGEVKLNDIKSNSLSVKIDAGNLELKNSDVPEMKLNSDAGNISLTNTTAKNLNISTDAGNISLDNSSIDYLTASLDAGNISATASTIKGGTCKSDLGNISLNGEIGNVQTSTSLGNVTINGK